jgi:hypothetical protein
VIDGDTMAPKGSTSTPKKAAPTVGKVKRSPVVGPIVSAPKWLNKVHTASTQARGVFVTWVTKPNGTASYVKPFKAHYEEECIARNLSEAWKVSAVMKRRDLKDPDANVALLSSPASAWGWDCFVTVADEAETAASIGKHITASFNEHAANAEEFVSQKYKPKYAFCGDQSAATNGLHPLSHFLLDEDVAQVFVSMFARENEKALMMGQDDILEAFFGSAEKGRQTLEECILNASA